MTFHDPDLLALQMARHPMALLAELGGTTDDVVSSLRMLKIRGALGEPKLCPLAVYLASRGVDSPVVSQDDVQWSSGCARLPAHLQEFVSEFDLEAHPALVAEKR